MSATFFPTPADFRAWLEANHETADEVWAGFYKRATGRPSMTWQQSVDQALCFGWIDGVRQRIDDDSYRIRFTPRKPRSTWSLVNVRRMRELIAEGLVAPAGLRAFEARREEATGIYSFEQAEVELGAGYEARFRADPAAWAFFEAQPPGYRRMAIHWVTSAKREETRQRRLAALIADSAAGRRLDPFAPGAGRQRS